MRCRIQFSARTFKMFHGPKHIKHLPSGPSLSLREIEITWKCNKTFSLDSKGTLNFEAYHCHSNINRSLAASTVHTVHAVTSML